MFLADNICDAIGLHKKRPLGKFRKGLNYENTI